MNTDIEFLDQQRMKFLKWYLIGFAIFLLLMLTRHFFRLEGLNSQPIGNVVLIGLIVALLVQVVSVIRSALLERQIHQDPRLEAALNNELVKALTTQSWIAAYIGACGMTLFFAITWSIYPICDPVTICLSSIIAGAGASRAYFYFKYKTL
jgi:DMSO reductase anchor subunit